MHANGYHREMRKLALAALLVLAILCGRPRDARADFGIGLFLGEPTGLDLKIGLSRKTALDIVLGATSFRDGAASYGHVTYLITVVAARGSSVIVPLRLGIGAAVYGVVEDNTGLAVRVPFELGFRFRRTPVEIYLEITPKVELIDDPDFNLDGGIGIRFYF